MNVHSILPLKATPGMPPRDSLSMPVQNLAKAPRALKRRPSNGVRLARLVTFGGAALIAAAGTYEMTQVVAVGGVTVIEAAMTAVFALTFAWIALSSCSALAGIIAPPPPHVRLGPAYNTMINKRGRLTTKTALVMPVYHEDPARTTAALEVMAKGIQALGEARAFEIVILSDSQQADAWVAETAGVERLRNALRNTMPVWYRRRWANTGKKAGNIKDFVENWGGRYAHFIVLDADSLMAPTTLVTLVAAMEVDSSLGLLQTSPTLARGTTLFARLQQFATRVYGPVVSLGYAAWQGSDGNFWGHNAIIRTRAFAAACGLPTLPGRQPFGGPILSHDFVEAALMRRAGWRVEMAPRLAGSWEESPPSLVDAATRDRRWAQGNLQHARVITARGLSWVSRAHLAIGIMSYCASLLWLGLIALGFALALQAHLIRPEYFSDSFQLFPTWPHLDSERMVRLFLATLLVLLIPKLIGVTRALFNRELRQGCGGAARLLASFAVELVVSALLAPIMLMIHSRQLYEILLGRDSGWSAQRRDGGKLSWAEAWERHRWHMMAGFATAGMAWLLSGAILEWLLPTLIGLFFAVPLSLASGSSRVGNMLRRAGLLVTPDETRPDPIFAARDEVLAAIPSLPPDGIMALATNEAVRTTHYKWTSSAPRLRGAPDPSYLTAADKLAEAGTLDEALAWLAPPERLHVAGHQRLAERLAGLANGDGPGPAFEAMLRKPELDPARNDGQRQSSAA